MLENPLKKYRNRSYCNKIAKSQLKHCQQEATPHVTKETKVWA
jgi:hypothetical protein